MMKLEVSLTINALACQTPMSPKASDPGVDWIRSPPWLDEEHYE